MNAMILDLDHCKQSVNFILNEYHAYLHEVLPKVEKLLHRIQRRHKNPTEAQREIVQVMTVVRAELSSHLFKEEETLFPMILDLFTKEDNSDRAEVLKTLKLLLEIMLGEHEGLEFLIEKAQKISDQLTDNVEDFDRLKNALDKIQANVRVHSKYEDDNLFNPLIEIINN